MLNRPALQKIFCVAILTMLLISSSCPGATVFLSSGKQITGKVSKSKGFVTVITPDGKKHKFPLSKVLYIAGDNGTGKTDEKSPSDKPTPENQSGDKSSVKNPADTGKTHANIPLTTGSATGDATPQERIFRLMRRRKDYQNPATGLATNEKVIENLRARAHDSEIMVGKKWMTPAQIKTKIKLFKQYIKEARKIASGRTKKGKKLSSKIAKRKALAKLRQAADNFPDHTLQVFLKGVIALEARRYSTASALFMTCMKSDPAILVYRQGLIRTYIRQKQFIKAFELLSESMKMYPDSSMLALFTQQLLAKVPGDVLKKSAAKNARALLDEFKKRNKKFASSSRSKDLLDPKSSYWVFPGKGVNSKAKSIPLPPAYHYETCKALAVPTAENTLLIDARALIGAAWARVRIAPGVYAYAKIRKITERSLRPGKPALATITVPSCSFTPVQIATDAKLSTKSILKVTSLNLFPSMGAKSRVFSAKITSVSLSGSVNLEQGLAPGEPAAPVFMKNGKFLGFLAGKLNYKTDSNPDTFYTTKNLAKLLKKRSSTSSSSKNTSPTPVVGSVFEVTIIKQYIPPKR